MGADGGTVPTRKEQVKTKSTCVKSGFLFQQRLRWMTCALSGEALGASICCDPLGNLMNRERVLEHLIAKSKILRKHFIFSKKDIRLVILQKNPSFDPSKLDEINLDGPYICPISGTSTTGMIQFICLPCGHAFSKKALKELNTSNCFACQSNYAEDDVIILIPDQEITNELILRLKEKRKTAVDKKADSHGNKRARCGLVSDGVLDHEEVGGGQYESHNSKNTKVQENVRMKDAKGSELITL